MTEMSIQEKFERAAGVICRQGLVPFPASPTAVAIIQRTVGEVEDELDLIYAFREKPSQTLEQLVASNGFTAEKAAVLADLREQTQGNYDARMLLIKASPAIDRIVPPGRSAGGQAIRVIPVDTPIAAREEFILPSQPVEDIIAKYDEIAVGQCFCRRRLRAR